MKCQVLRVLQVASVLLTFVALNLAVYGIVFASAGSTNSTSSRLVLDSGPDREPKTLIQPLDHFDTQNQSFWLQRYWTNDRFFNGTGPVFLVIGGESEENGALIFKDSLVTQLASELGALMVVLEHRFYGQSRPTPDASTRNLRFLSRDQILADLVSFRNFIHTSYGLSKRNKWAAFGCSYPGELAAWLRLKHPASFHAALASSAPVKHELEYRGFIRIVNSAIESFSPACAEALDRAMSSINSRLTADNGSSLGSEAQQQDFQLFLESVASSWMNAVQYYPNGGPPLGYLCARMLDTSVADPSMRLLGIPLASAKPVAEPANQSGVSWDSVAAENYTRNWAYQRCFELGQFPTSLPTDGPLRADISLDSSIQSCRHAFAETFNLERLKRTLEARANEFGGERYRGSRVVFVNGAMDPLSAAGFTSAPPNSRTRVVLIDGAAHCADFLGHQAQNPAPLNRAVASIKQHLKEFLLE